MVMNIAVTDPAANIAICSNIFINRTSALLGIKDVFRSNNISGNVIVLFQKMERV